MTSWRENAIEIIGQIHAGLPEDADLKTRRAALRTGRPHWFSGTSWGRKVWAACARDYLRRHGQDPGYGRRKAPESPMERMMRRGGA